MTIEIIKPLNCCILPPGMRRGDAFGRVHLSVFVCLSVCLSFSCSKFWKLWHPYFGVQVYFENRSSSHIRVIGSRSRSQKQKG